MQQQLGTKRCAQLHFLQATTKLILLDSLLQEVVVTLPHLVLQRPTTAKMREAPTGAGTPHNTYF